MTRMTPKEFQKFLDRDGRCVHCGATEGLVPQHRANRQMGGSKAREVPSNVVVLCSSFNNEIEANGYAAEIARSRGWKLRNWQEPLKYPIYDVSTNACYFLLDDYTRIKAVA